MTDISPAEEYVPLPEIQIFPERLLSADTTEKLLRRLRQIKDVRQINVHGETLPNKVKYGPGTGLDVNHPERKKIQVEDEEMELRVQVGRVFVEVNDIDNVQPVLEEVEEVCEDLLSFDFSLEVGRYSKFKPTVSDYKKGLR